jgi:hypothetical protein
VLTAGFISLLLPVNIAPHTRPIKLGEVSQ